MDELERARREAEEEMVPVSEGGSTVYVKKRGRPKSPVRTVTVGNVRPEPAPRVAALEEIAHVDGKVEEPVYEEEDREEPEVEVQTYQKMPEPEKEMTVVEKISSGIEVIVKYARFRESVKMAPNVQEDYYNFESPVFRNITCHLVYSFLVITNAKKEVTLIPMANCRDIHV